MVHKDAQTERGTPYQPLVVLAVAACAGVVFDHYMPGPALVWQLAALTAWLAWLGSWRRHYERLSSCVLLLSVFALAAAWHHCRWTLYDESELGVCATDEPQPVYLRGVAATAPRQVPAEAFDPMRGRQSQELTRLTVDVAALRDGTSWRPTTGTVRVTVRGQLLGIRAGQPLDLVGQLTTPGVALNPGDVDYDELARTRRERSVLFAESPDCLMPFGGPREGLRYSLENWRSAGDGLLWQHLTHDRSGLAAALLLDMREQLEPQRTAAFFETGTIHLLAISGQHVAILAGCLFWALRLGLVRRIPALVGVALVTLAYALVIDAQAPAVRAAVLVMLICAAQGLGRRSGTPGALAIGGLAVIALNPAELFRAGTQLSFLAVIALVWFSAMRARAPQPDALARLIAETRPLPVRMVKNAARTVLHGVGLTAAVWLVTLPLVASQFHLASPSALVLTPLLVLPVAVGLMSGFGVLILGWLLPPLAMPCGWVCDKSLSIVDTSVRWAQHLPASRYWVSGPDVWWSLGLYGAIALAIAFPRLTPPWRWRIALLALWIAVGSGAHWHAHRPKDRLDCTFLSVGHGCAVALELPGGQTLLYDAGEMSSPRRGTRSIAGYLWSRGISHIDAVVLSHADIDHFNALPGTVRLEPHSRRKPV